MFRGGFLRKDSNDSLFKLMSEIEDLERSKQESPASKYQRISKIEVENDDDILMSELKKMAVSPNVNDDADSFLDPEADGGNGDKSGDTSFDSMMEDTPSNYNLMNQRFMVAESIKNRVRANLRGAAQLQVREARDDEEEEELKEMPSEYSLA